VGSAIVAVAGLLLWALNTNAPSSETLKLVGQVVGLAAMVAGPVLVWTML
jgi:multidrug resistance efflux pump